MSVALRAGAARDFAALAEFWVAAWAATGFDIDFEARRPWLLRHLAQLVEEGAEIVVACADGGAPVGFVTLDRRTGYLDQLCVAPAAQRQGVAAALIAEAKRLAPGRLELHVNVENPRARALYQRAGFVVAAEAVSALSGRPTLLLTWTDPQNGVFGFRKDEEAATPYPIA
ncbi:MAG: GNAT family N-acetyltransferase [Pseudomonadota bacterium]|nr:GNAT family N-acetyltransferase [Pseudomonadota bacterium]